jgi:hypothetical protein
VADARLQLCVLFALDALLCVFVCHGRLCITLLQDVTCHHQLQNQLASINHCSLGFCQLAPCVVLPARQVDLDKLDYHHYLPIFFDGIRETQDPYRFLAIKGVEDLLAAGEPSSSPPQIVTDIQLGGAAVRHVHATPE